METSLAVHRWSPIPYPYAVLLNADGAGPMDKCPIFSFELSAQSPILGHMSFEPALFAFCKKWVGIEEISIGPLVSVPQTLSLWMSIFNSHDKVNEKALSNQLTVGLIFTVDIKNKISAAPRNAHMCYIDPYMTMNGKHLKTDEIPD